jgi:hypothetical protein
MLTYWLDWTISVYRHLLRQSVATESGDRVKGYVHDYVLSLVHYIPIIGMDSCHQI